MASPLISTGMATALLGTASLKDTIAGGKIDIYSGTAPTTADLAATGTLLCTITLGADSSTGVDLDSASSGTISKVSTDTWSGTNVATGTATHFRWTTLADDETESTDYARIQGTCSTSGAHMNMTTVELTSGETTQINAASISFAS